jgi:hypothetical protein
MSGSRPKPEIPSWQRAPITPATEDPVPAQTTKGEAAPESKGENGGNPTWQQKTTTPATEDPVYAQPAESAESEQDSKSEGSTTWQQKPDTPATEDPVYAQPATEASIESRDTTIAASSTQKAGAPQSFNAADVDNFRTSDVSKQHQSPPLPITAAPPPIITYPEFLVNAHQPPPLITPTRVVNTLYAAGSLAALLYGGAKFLVEPMVASLSESRHDLYTHSQSKVDEFNARLSKLVSKVPDISKEQEGGRAPDTDDLDSVTSDPTELYHRDMGTQTDVVPPSVSRKTASSPSDDSADSLVALAKLSALSSHLNSLLESTSKNAESAQERITSVQNLRAYLDTLCYASSGISTWNTNGQTDKAGTKNEDAVDELKREIRNVKGVLLSAKRFPSYATTGYYAGTASAGK